MKLGNSTLQHNFHSLIEQTKAHVVVRFLLHSILASSLHLVLRVQTFSSSFSGFFSSAAGAAAAPPAAGAAATAPPPPDGTCIINLAVYHSFVGDKRTDASLDEPSAINYISTITNKRLQQKGKNLRQQ